VYTGVMVLYADEVSFTVMTAEGLPEGEAGTRLAPTKMKTALQ
jgi:hypothetical protein